MSKRTVLYGSVSVLLALIVLIGIIGWSTHILPMVLKQARSWAAQAEYHRNLYETVIRPKAAWITGFYAQHQRLPTQEELEQSLTSTIAVRLMIYTNAPEGDRPWPNAGRDFMLCAVAGDWALYLRSWDKKEFKYWTD